MNKKIRGYCILSYVTWIGFLIAWFRADRNERLIRHHLNQALALNILGSVYGILSRHTGGLLYLIGELLGLLILVLLVIGVVRAAKLSDKPLPLIGEVHLLD